MISFAEELTAEWQALSQRVADTAAQDDGAMVAQVQAIEALLGRALEAGRFISRSGDRHLLTVIAAEAGDQLFRLTGTFPRVAIDELDFVAYFPPRTSYFTGRSGFLQQLHHLLFESRPANGMLAVAGLGGMGKTQTVLEYVRRHADDYSHVFWVKATTRWDLEEGLQKMAEILQLCDLDGAQAVRASVRVWLESQSEWLLVLDDAHDPGAIAELVPEAHAGHVLITTRRREFGGARVLALAEMSDSEAADLLLCRTGQEPTAAGAPNSSHDRATGADHSTLRAHARDIAAALGRYPLALEQAGAFLALPAVGTSAERAPVAVADEVTSRFRDYLRHLGAEPVSGLMEVGLDPVLHASVTATLRLCVRQLGERELAVLRCCACVAPSGIPVSLLRDNRDALAGEQSFPRDAGDWDAVIQAGGEQSLLAYNRRRDSFDMHPIVQRIVLEDLGGDARERLLAAWAEVLNPLFPTFKAPTWAQFRPYFRHVLALVEHCRANGVRTRAVARLTHESAQFLMQLIGDAKYAIELFKRAIEIKTEVFAPKHRQVACSLNALGGAYLRDGDTAAAERCYQRALAMRIKIDGESHPLTARSNSSLGRLYRSLDRDEESIVQFEKAWKVGFGESAPISSSLSANEAARREGWKANWAWCLSRLGRVHDAERVFLDACEQRAHLLGESHPQVLENLRELAEFYTEQGQLEDADGCWRRALNQARQGGRCNLHVVKALDGCARLRHREGRLDEAEALFGEALEQARQLGATPESTRILDHWAELLEADEQQPQARARAQRLRAEAADAEDPNGGIPRHSYLNIYEIDPDSMLS